MVFIVVLMMVSLLALFRIDDFIRASSMPA
jgi:hypothetical protein